MKDLEILLVFVSLAGSLIVWFLIGRFFWWQGQAGVVLLDLGCHPRRTPYLMIAVLFALASVTNAMSSDIQLSALIFTISSTLFSLGSALSKRQIRARGLLSFPMIAPWENIKSYQWNKDAVLKVKQGSPFTDFDIPCPRTAALDALLAEHVAQTQSAQQ